MKNIFTLYLLLLTSSSLWAQSTFDRLIFGTGEYDPKRDWHAILRIEHADTLDSTPSGTLYTPSSEFEVRQCSSAGVSLNFAHGMYMNESTDELYISTLFTNSGNYLTANSDTAVGSIAIFDNISTLTSPTSPSRHIFGPNTQLKQPHGCWVDETRDILYVANTFGNSILVFDNASTINGDVAPNRVITHDSLFNPVYCFVDDSLNILFAACMDMGIPGARPNISVYPGASTVSGIAPPLVRIIGNSTRLSVGNHTVHNCWYNRGNKLLAVGHHTKELLFFDLSSINLIPVTPTDHDIAPRVIRINESPTDADINDWSLYGFHWNTGDDIIYLSAGYTPGGGGPNPDSTKQAVKVFEGVSSPADSGRVTANRIIHWTSGAQYFPPQPIWVTQVPTVGIEESLLTESHFTIYPNPSQGVVHLYAEVPGIKSATAIYRDALGRKLMEQTLSSQNGFISEWKSTENLSKGIYFVELKTEFGSVFRSMVVE